MLEPYYSDMAASTLAKKAIIIELPQWVRMWMMWMQFIFFSGLWFSLKHIEARVAVLVYVLGVIATTMHSYYYGWGLLWGAIHIVFWVPLLYFMFMRRVKFSWKDPFSLWSHILMGTMVFSLIFDARDTALYFIQ